MPPEFLTAMADCVVLAEPQHHHQTYATVYNPAYRPAYRGEITVPLDGVQPMVLDERKIIGKYPPAKPGALGIAPLKAALIDHAHYTHSMTDRLGPILSRGFPRARMRPIHYVCTL
jgi:hypothetical protein